MKNNSIKYSKVITSTLILIVLITGMQKVMGQGRLQFSAPFAPSVSWTQPQELPYRQNICLNGSWRFAPEMLPEGFKEGFDAPPALPDFSTAHFDKTPIRIPSPWNVNNFADKDGQGGDFVTYPSYPKSWEKIKMGWLYRKFVVPADWKGKRLLLHFEALAGDAVIQINGKNAGHHFGIFLPFDIDVSDFVLPGRENEISIGIRKASLFDHRGNYGRRTYQAGSFWGQHIAGIWQDVELVALPQTGINNVFVRPLVDSGKLAATITLHNGTGRPADMEISGAVYTWTNKTDTSTLTAPVPDGEAGKTPVLLLKKIRITVPAHSERRVELAAAVVNELKLWSPESPNLYGLVISTSEHNKITDQKYTRFGWRQTQIKGKELLLNGRPIVLKGDSWHFMGIPQMTRRYAWAWYKAIKDAHLNAVRLHAEPYPSFYLDMADEMGIMVLDETAMWASDGGPKLDDPAYWKDSEEHMAELVLRDRNHASIFGWSVSNEIMSIVRGVMHNPPGMKDILVDHYRIWADTCKKLDPTRPWISADGEDDGEGKLPTYVVHYGGFQSMDRGLKSDKPWGVGEAGNAYYGTPEQVAATNGDRAYASFLGRMEGVAVSSYQSLLAQRDRHATYQSVFNLVWYGLQPLSLGLKDTSNIPRPEDGVFFGPFKENTEGVQPERLGPYVTTLNPGYDPALPLYKTWPLFEAIRDASAEILQPSKWAKAVIPSPGPAAEHPTVKKKFAILAGGGSKLEEDLKNIGLIISEHQSIKHPDIILIDGLYPPDEPAKTIMDYTLSHGGKVIIFGVSKSNSSKLNTLLPAPVEVIERAASSLLIGAAGDMTAGMSLSDLYFSEQNPADVIQTGLTGPLVQQSKVLLKAANTDWLKWNKQPEYAKTAMVIRSEREEKPAGNVLISHQTGRGELMVTTFPIHTSLLKVQLAARKMLANLGLPLSQNTNTGAAFKNDLLVHTLSCGAFISTDSNTALSASQFDFNKGAFVKNGSETAGMKWGSVYNENGSFDFTPKNRPAAKNEVIYMSYWLASPRSLEDLLLEPNLPTVNMEVNTTGGVGVWLNGNPVLQDINRDRTSSGREVSEPLKLRRGWNQVIIRLVRTNSTWTFASRLISNQPDFIKSLDSAIEKP